MTDREERQEDSIEAGKSLQSDRLKILEKAGISYEKIIKEFKATGFANIKDYFDVAEGGELSFKPFDTLSRSKASAIKKIKEKTVITESKDGEKIYKTSTVEIELWDKHAALWRLIELRGDKPADKQEITGINGGPIEFSRLERANRIAAIAEAARKRKEGEQ